MRASTCEACGATIQNRTTGRPRKTCSEACRAVKARSYQRQRNRRLRQPRKPSSSPTLEALRADSPLGCCIMCDEPLPVADGPGRKRTICRTYECGRAYMAAWRADRQPQVEP